MARNLSNGKIKYILASAVALTVLMTGHGKVMRQEIINPNFKTLKVEKENDFFGLPVLTLNGNDRIVISFDEIADDYSHLQFRLIHCNADWQPSRLIESEYVDGFNYDDIEDYAFSSNTFTNYVNYRFTIPSEHIVPMVSGNYIAEVYPQSDPDDVLLRARFQVSEETARVNGFSSPRTDRGFNSDWQQLTFEVIPTASNINPYSDIVVTVSQNRRPDTERVVSHPMKVEGTKIIYDHLPELIFPASNEYRRFETVRADYPGMGVESVGFEDRSYQAWLRTDSERAEHEYLFDSTQRGRFKIDEYNSSDPDLGADYVTVHFTLDFPELMNGDIFVEGDFTNHRYEDQYRMTYNRDSGVYELALPLKQGSYNYQYVAVKKEEGPEGKGDASLVEGDKYETLNEYNICVYYKPAIARADRLIGTATIVAKP